MLLCRMLTFPMLSLLISSLLLLPLHAAVITDTWHITYKFVNPDGVEKLVPVVNNQYPGPTLRGAPGDLVKILVVNELPTESTSIHWHGIKQENTPWADGVPGITQCAIGPGQEFLYEFVLDAPGTLWWHSHSGFQKSSLYGFIIVDGDQEVVGEYEEINLLLNDWYHEDSNTQIAGLFEKEFRWVGDANSLLVNGEGVFNCEETKKDCVEKTPPIIDVEPNTTYRVRLVGASSLAFINFGIDKHPVKLVEAETTLLKPFQTNFLDLGAGQSVSVLLKTKTRKELKKIKKNNGLFWIQTNVQLRTSGPRGLAILRYRTANSGDALPKRRIPNPPEREDVEWSLRHARRYRALEKADLPPATRTLVFLGTQNRASDGRLVWSMNNISFTFQSTPILHSIAMGIEEETDQFVETTNIPTVFDYNLTLGEAGLSEIAKTGTQVVKIEKDEVVDFVFQNTRALNGADEVHPWHLHLHNFWVLGFGDTHSTWTQKDSQNYDTKTPVSRNTFALLPGGWTAIRVKADNPGAAHFHCHILAHLVMGMGFVLQVGEQSDIPSPPPGIPMCGIV